MQRFRLRVENFGFFSDLAMLDVLAIVSFVCALSALKIFRYKVPYAVRNGIPKCFSNARAWSSFFAVVTMVTFMPLSFSTFA